MAKRYEPSDAQWARIAELLPGKKGDRGRTAKDNRIFVDGVLWVLRSGARWCDLPERYGKWKSVHKRFTRWAKAGVWERMFAVLTKDRRNEYLMLDTSLVRAHQQAATGKGGQDQALGRSRGGLTTKIHLLADALGRPLRFILTPGQAHDLTQAHALLDGQTTRQVIADRGYDSNAFRSLVADLGAKAVVPAKSSRITNIRHDAKAYRLRNRIERCFNKLKHFRRIATRYDRRDVHFLAALCLAGALQWLPA
jgi:transposase